MTDTDIPQQENKDSSYSTSQAERKIMDSRSELLDRILDAIFAEQYDPRNHQKMTQMQAKELLTGLIAAQKQRWASSIPEPTLQDVIAAGMFPTPAEYEKMIWMLRWYKDRLSALDGVIGGKK